MVSKRPLFLFGAFFENNFKINYMFKVICIDASIGRTYGRIPKFKEGDVLDACNSYNKDYYKILQDCVAPSGANLYWHKDRFIPLSNIDETEMIREQITICETI